MAKQLFLQAQELDLDIRYISSVSKLPPANYKKKNNINCQK